jgi:ATP-dependent helicase/nuclease subunit B
LLELSSENLEHLTRGGTLVVPSPQRAAALRIAYTGAQLASGRRVWSSPDVLPWSAWLARGLDEARARGVPVPRRLSAAEDWWLWRDAVRAACEQQPVLSPDALIDSVRRAALLIEDYALELRDPLTPETVVLLRAREHFQRQCSALQALWSASWSACVNYLKPAAPTRLVGFGDLAPARRSWLERNGIVIDAPPPLETVRAHSQRDLFIPDPGAAVEVSGFDTPDLEAEAAAQWCAALLEHDPRARMLLVVPRLQERRHRWLRALSQRLDYRTILEPGAAAADSHFAVEGGQPLTDYALVATALQLLALAAGEADFSALSALLRSPFLDAQRYAVRLQIDVWLRQHNVEATRPASLPTLIEPIRRALGEPAAAAWRALLEVLPAPPRSMPASTPAPASVWAEIFADLLARAGWPGPLLDSQEQQIRLRFDELLGEFAALSVAPHALSLPHALQWLQQLAGRIAFEPASDDVPVTVTASLDDPIVRYDGIWVAGLTADAWPEAARADPLIPWHLQRKAGMPMAGPEDPLRQAERALRQWRRATARLALSWPRSDGESLRHESPLLRHWGDAARTGAAAHGAGASFRLEPWLAAHAPELEIWHDASVPVEPSVDRLAGGVRLLELQASCPFRGFAELRLEAEPLPEPQPGIDPRLRGHILHASLERFWGEMRDSHSLQARAPEATRQLADECIAAALEEVGRRWPALSEADELQREAARVARLLEQLITWERTRAPFEVARLEWSEPLALAGTTLMVRLDRVDRLADGRLIVIDYKSGAAKPFDPLAERPRLPQLPAYALVAGGDTAAVVALHLSKEGLKLRGIADRSGRLKKLNGLKAAAPSWQQLQDRWREQLERLTQEFLAGLAAVDPQPEACELCHLQAFCRVRLEGLSW